ncbi:MAG: zinc-ribbon domain-containing protein [Chloroflexota bacterium]|nr:zinc-ribbon domain-containing protein [Dehalococcoidia bacterium]MDW8252851.1 zinc-ribbon domain-containing protein [Chloroflexota bacterium]
MPSAVQRCFQCGAPLAPSQRFCDQCGAHVILATPAAPSSSAAQGERAAAPAARQSSMTGCCLAAVVGFVVVFCVGVALAGGAAYFLGSGFSFGP